MRVSNTAAVLALTGAGVVRAAPLQAPSTSISLGTSTSLETARRRGSVGVQTRGLAVNLNRKGGQEAYIGRGSTQSGTGATLIEVKQTPSAHSAAPAANMMAALTASLQTLPQAEQAIIAHKLKAGETIELGSIGVKCPSCKSDANWVIKKRDDVQQGKESRQKPPASYVSSKAFFIAGGVVIGVVFVAGCALTLPSDVRRIRRKAKHQAAARRDVELADRGRSATPVVEQPRPAHIDQRASAPTANFSDEPTMHNPYSGRWQQFWYSHQLPK